MASQTSYAPVDQDRKAPDNSPEVRPLPGRRVKQRNCWTRWTDDGWLLEVASTVLGILFIIVLVVVLRHYDGKPIAPASGRGAAVSPNTVTAILSTVAKAALLYPVGACIGQLKWVWFSQGSRRLHDMAVFDSASRGIWGGFELIWKTKLSTFAVLGALLMIYGIAIDPLSQQLVSYVSVSVPTTGNGTVRITNEWMDFGGGNDGAVLTSATINGNLDDSGISTGMRAAIQSSLYVANETVLDIAPDCSSLNCTFLSYTSLAVCTSFADVTSHLASVNVTRDPDPRARPLFVDALSNSSYINKSGGRFNASSAAFDDSRSGSRAFSERAPFLIFNNTIAFKDVPVPLADVFVIYAKEIVGEFTRPDGVIEAGHMSYGAVEFIMEWCVQNFTTVVVNGVAHTTRGTATRNFTNSVDPVKQVGEEEYYTVIHSAHYTTSRYLDHILRGSVLQGSDQMLYASTDVGIALYEPYNVWSPHSSSLDYSKSTLSGGLRGTNQTGLEHIINNVATGMTNFIRRSSNQVANGTMYKEELLVKVRWKWIAAHVAFVALCVLLLVATVVATHFSDLRDHAWKSSPSAALHALNPGLQMEGGGVTTVSDMLASEREQVVRLCVVEDEGWRLVPHDVK